MDRLANYVDGKMVEPVAGEYLDNVDPATGMTYSLVPQSDADDVDLSVSAAERAFPHACPLATTSWLARWTSCGGHGVRLNSGNGR